MPSHNQIQIFPPINNTTLLPLLLPKATFHKTYYSIKTPQTPKRSTSRQKKMPRRNRQAQPDVPHVVTCRVEDHIVESMKRINLRAFWEAKLQTQYSPSSNRMIIAVPLFSFKAWSASEKAHIIELAT